MTECPEQSGAAPARLSDVVRGFSFNPAFLGPAVMLVWTQCMLYARYLWVDAGLTTVAINYARCAFIAALALVALRGGFDARFQRVLAVVSVVLMTLASLLFYLLGYLDEPVWATAVATVLAGVGVTWGEGSWIKVYARLSPRECLLYALASLVAFSCVGLFVGFVPEHISFLIGMLLPMVAYLMYGRAMDTLDAREGASAPEVPAAVDDVYAAEPRSSLVRVLVGIALFSFVMGVSRGFPYGTSIRIGQPFQMVQHLVLIGVGCLVAWRTLVRGRRLRFVVLWEVQLAVMAAGVLLLSTYDPLATVAGATAMAVANLCQVIFLWLTVIDYARHRAGSAFHALAAVWLCHLFFRETGRLAIVGVTEHALADASVILAVLIGLLVACMAIVLTGPIPRTRPLFADFHVRGADGEGLLRACAPGDGPGRAMPPEPEDGRARAWLVGEGGLTEREADVALLLAEGRSTPYVARELVLAENTVRGYTKTIYEKLDVHSKQQLIDLVRGL